MSLQKHEVDSRFENAYLSVRREEGRVYSLEQIRRLPETDSSDPNAAEWKRRAKSTKRFLDFASSKTSFSCLDLGCGNGWMMNRLLDHCSFLAGVDVNQFELEQAASLFENEEKVQLVYGDIFKIELKQKVDLVLIFAAVQYFPDLHQLLQRLGALLNDGGSVHILDSPFYKDADLAEAKKRSADYYKNHSTPEMADFYHHQSWSAINQYKPILHYDPSSLASKLKNKLSPDSPFPWIEIKKKNIV